MSEIEKKWYVLRSVSGKESKVRELLEVEMNKTDLGKYLHQVLIPTEKTFITRNGKKIAQDRAYLPGYILIEASLTGEVIHTLKNLNFIVGFLPNTTNPQPLSQKEVNRILGTVDDLEGRDAILDMEFFVGEHVKVTNGPFAEFTGVIEKINAEKKKLTVMVKIFGRKTPLDLNYTQVEKEA